MERIPTEQIANDDIRDTGKPDPELATLADSIEAVGQQQPVVVYRNPPGSAKPYSVFEGNRRAAACLSKGIPTVLAIVLDAPPQNKTLAQLAENTARKPLATVETVKAVAKAKAEAPGRQNQDIAKGSGCSQGEVSKCLTIAACPVTMAALEEGKLDGMEAAYLVARGPEDTKKILLHLYGTGATVKQMADAARPKRETVKVERVRLAFPGGSVTVAGPGIDLSGLIETLGEILVQARKADKDSLDIKTFSRVLADKAGG